MRPSGTVTFLFTDVEGSTQSWEADAETMEVDLAAHDEVLRTAIEREGGWMFKHTGDGVCAAFDTAQAGLDAAVSAQRSLGLSVRMGLTTGEAAPRSDDYFGPTLNRAARVMAVGHGGQILLSTSTAALVTQADLVDLGTHRLRDLSGEEHLFQVRADGLESGFPPLRTIDAVPGNLPSQTTSFIGRGEHVTEVSKLVMNHRLVTLTGVGGVGKSRLAVQVAADVAPEFTDGVWLVELAPVAESASVPDAVATALGVRTQAGRSVIESVVEALTGRRMLIVLDNCEHVLDVAADVVETIVRSSPTVSLLATSREGLRLDLEQLWVVPALDVSIGLRSAAVELFTDRARSVADGFTLETDVDADAVIEICRRLDGVALGIELASARMVSMSPTEVLQRLDDRFRLLSGSQRTPERHHTLRHAVQWSYDLLNPDEQTVLGACSVFAGGFDLVGVAAVAPRYDEYELLDIVDSLVRKSLVTTSRSGAATRYRLLETIRHFARDQVAGDGDDVGGLAELRDRHAQHFAEQVVARWDIWEGPEQRAATDWVAVEFDNLRAGFHWANVSGDVASASAIAAHSMAISFNLQRFEPVAWAEEVLPAAIDAEVAYLPRLYFAASFCQFAGRSPNALEYIEAAFALQHDSRFVPFDVGWTRHRTALIHLIDGRAERYVEICSDRAEQTDLSRVFGLCGLAYGLPLVGRAEEAAAIADDAIAAAQALASPVRIAFAYLGAGRACTELDPVRALGILREGVAYARAQLIPHFEALLAGEAAGLEAAHGDPERAIELFASTLDSFHRAGDRVNLMGTFQQLVAFFDRAGEAEVAATIYGMTVDHDFANRMVGEANVDAKLRDVLDADAFKRCVRAGSAMTASEAVGYSNTHVRGALAHEHPHP